MLKNNGEFIHANLSHDKSGGDRKVLHMESIKSGHNGEISCKSGILVKIRSIQERKSGTSRLKTRRLGKYESWDRVRF